MAVRLRAEDLGLRSKIAGFGALFGGDDFYVMPYLQRPYEWGEGEVADMTGDLMSACFGGYTTYFLGHVVGVRNDAGLVEIIDGQQRFITTTALLSYLRDGVSDKALAAELQDCMMKAGRARVTPRPSDAGFLKEWVQTPGQIKQLYTPWGKNEEPYRTETDAQALMVQAARTIHEKLQRLAVSKLEELAVFILDRAVVDFIIADNRTLAAILYRGMNMRGKQLSPADLLKLEAIEGTGLAEASKETAARVWESKEDALGRDNFAFLLEILPLILSRQTTERPGDIGEWRKHAFRTLDAETILLKLLPVYADVFEELMSGEIRANCRDRVDEQALATVNRLLRGLLFLQERHWIAPAIGAVHAHRDRPLFLMQYFKGLDRLSYACFLDGVRHEDRAERFAAVVRAGADETQLSHAFSLRAAEAAGMLRRLGEPFKRHSWRRRAAAVRINAALPGAATFGPGEDVTVEHILPTSACATWAAAGFSAAQQAACANLIGNFVLVTAALNNRASQKSFEEKRKLYFEGARVLPLTEDVRRYGEWTERAIRERTERLIRIVAQDWDLA
jgi:hypothetical protein